MFSLMNLHNKDTIKIRVKLKEDYIDFYLGGVVNKKNTSDIDQSNSFHILNQYLDYKGEQVKEEVFNILQDAINVIYKEQKKEHLDDVPSYIIQPLLNIAPLEDILNFVKRNSTIIIPSSLKHEFDQNIEDSGKGSRDQTYLIEDYHYLIALSVIMKLTIAPMGHYAFTMKDKINSNMICYMLIHFYRDSDIFHSQPMVKLRVMIQKILDKKDSETSNVDIIRYNIPKEELCIYMLSLVLIQKVALATFDGSNIINNIYNYIKNKTNIEMSASNNLKNKIPLIDSDTNDKESIIESYRLTTCIPDGFITEINWSISTINMIIHQLPKGMIKYIDQGLIDVAIGCCDELRLGAIKRPQVDIVSCIFKSVIDPRAIYYVNIDNLLNLFCVAFSYLYKMGYYELAVIIMSKSIDTSNEVYIPTTNRNRIEKRLKDALEYYYPYKEVKGSDSKNMMEEYINTLCNDISIINWVPLVDDKYLDKLIGHNIQERLIHGNIKNVLVDFFITTEKIIAEEM